jgi:CubicO group peptidase (beta-lactamase class C family)
MTLKHPPSRAASQSNGRLRREARSSISLGLALSAQRFVRTALVICALALMAASAGATAPPRNGAAAASAAGAPSLSAAQLEAFFDPYFARHVATSEFPGAAVVVVKDGRILFEKGYGYTDFKKTRPVSPDRTVFYAASVSKLFVATAIMQLAQQKRLGVSDDVNKYLKGFQLENRFGKQVAIANLLTHTGGLDEHLLRTEMPIDARPMPMGEYFARYTPRRILPPGDQINYSNHGMALAGYVVERVSGMPFYAYAEKNIFAPLGMAHSTFRQPVPAAVAADMGLRRFEPAYLIPYPAGSLVTSAEDMGRFMLAHLSGGATGAGPVLDPEFVADMHREHFTSHANMPGVAYGFFESFANHRRGLFHTGSRDHQSLLYLMPEENLGIYMVLSGTDAEGALCGDVLQAFLNRFYSDIRARADADRVPSPGASRVRKGLGRYSGIYRVNLVSRTSIERIAALGMDAHVTQEKNGGLSLALPGLERAGRITRLVEIEPLFFRTADGGFVAFRADARGHITKMFMSGGTSDPMSFDKIHWYESGRFHVALIIAGFGVFFLFLLISLIGGLVRVIRKRVTGTRTVETLPSADQDGWERWAWHLAALVSMLVVLSPLSAIVMALLTREHQLYNIPPLLYVSLSFLLAAAVLGLALPFLAVRAWKLRYWSPAARAAFSLVALTSLLMMPMMDLWNVLGFRF